MNIHLFGSVLSLRPAVVLWEMLTYQLPWAGENPWSVVTNVAEGGRLPFPPRETLPGGDFEGLNAFMELIDDCWAQEPAARPNFAEVIARIRCVAFARRRWFTPVC